MLAVCQVPSRYQKELSCMLAKGNSTKTHFITNSEVNSEPSDDSDVA